MDPADFKIEVLRPEPRGGQHAGVLPVGVKVTHVPTGLSASCATERSQMKNRNVALSMIEWGLAEIGFAK